MKMFKPRSLDVWCAWIMTSASGAAKGMAIQFANAQGHNRFVRDDLLLYAMTKKYLSMWDQNQAFTASCK
ncbi:MAG: hypothetical protein R2877_06275 [Bdellovibrionota bacterium]